MEGEKKNKRLELKHKLLDFIAGASLELKHPLPLNPEYLSACLEIACFEQSTIEMGLNENEVAESGQESIKKMCISLSLQILTSEMKKRPEFEYHEDFLQKMQSVTI